MDLVGDIAVAAASSANFAADEPDAEDNDDEDPLFLRFDQRPNIVPIYTRKQSKNMWSQEEYVPDEIVNLNCQKNPKI